MRHLAALSLLCVACRFGIAPIKSDDARDLGAPVGGVGASPGDLGRPVADLGAPAGDLAVPAGDFAVVPDLADDPCGPALTPPANVLGARCTIGAPPVLDGDLSEWGTLDYELTHRDAQYQSSPSTWGGPIKDDANSSARFSLRWDLSNLYVAVHVSDDVRGLHPGAANYEVFLDDAVELFLDGLGDRTASYGADDHQFIVTADAHSQEYKTGNAQGPMSATYFAVKPDAAGAGYSVEYRVPWSALGGVAAANGRTLGFDLEIDDDDDSSAQQTLTHYLVWWNTVSGGCATAPACTSNFGSAQLVGR